MGQKELVVDWGTLVVVLWPTNSIVIASTQVNSPTSSSWTSTKIENFTLDQRVSPPVLEITTLFMSIHSLQPLSYLVIENVDGVLHLIKTVHGCLLLRQKKKVFLHLLPVETTTLFLSVL